MARVSLSSNNDSIEDIWNWYEDQKEALRDYRNKIFNSITSPDDSFIQEKFIGITLDELNSYFEKSIEELDHLVCFDLISAIEGQLRSNFFIRVYNKEKDGLSRVFRETYKIKGEKINLEVDIISPWKNKFPAEKSNFSAFLGLLHYRHWLAHGRYWNLTKKGRQYTTDETFDIAEGVLQCFVNELQVNEVSR